MASIPTNEEIASAFGRADKPVQEYTGSVELMKAFIEIRDRYKLHLDEAGNISRALNAVFVGLRPATEFPELLKAALEQNSGAYNAVLRDIDEKIFVQFRRKMQERSAASPPSAAVQKPQSSIDRFEERVMGDTKPGAAAEPIPPVQPTPSREQSAPKKADPYREPIE